MFISEGFETDASLQRKVQREATQVKQTKTTMKECRMFSRLGEDVMQPRIPGRDFSDNLTAAENFCLSKPENLLIGGQARSDGLMLNA